MYERHGGAAIGIDAIPLAPPPVLRSNWYTTTSEILRMAGMEALVPPAVSSPKTAIEVEAASKSNQQIMRDSFIKHMNGELNKVFAMSFNRWSWILALIPSAQNLSQLRIRSNVDALDLLKYLYGKYESSLRDTAHYYHENAKLQKEIRKLKKKLKKAKRK